MVIIVAVMATFVIVSSIVLSVLLMPFKIKLFLNIGLLFLYCLAFLIYIALYLSSGFTRLCL